jgi:hypothetical protein
MFSGAKTIRLSFPTTIVMKLNKKNLDRSSVEW